MVFLLVRHKVEDYEKFRVVYDEAQGIAESFGQVTSRAFQELDDPNMVTVLAEFNTEENVKKFMESLELKEAMKKAGVAGEPEIHFLKED